MNTDPSGPQEFAFDLDLAGVVLGDRYEVSSLLGKGGMGSVYLARDRNLEVEVVIKLPDPTLLSQEGFRERFEREVESLVRLDHPHIVKALNAGSYRGVPYIVLQHLPEGSVRGRIAWNGGRLPAEDVAKWLPGVASALDAIHAKGTLHRDIKPANILFDKSGIPYVADFGIAKVLDDESQKSLTQTGVTPGSPEYMAPEVVGGESLTFAYDQYALGVVVYQALSGELPVTGRTPLEALVKKRTTPPTPLHKVAPEVPPGSAAAVMRAINPAPVRRFPSCGAFARAFVEGIAAAATVATPAQVTPQVGRAQRPERVGARAQRRVQPGAARRRRRNQALVWGAVVVGVAALLALARGGKDDTGPGVTDSTRAQAPRIVDERATVTDTHLRISGRVIDADLLTVKANREVVSHRADGTFTADIPRSTESSLEVQIRAVDRAGHETVSATVHVVPMRAPAAPWASVVAEAVAAGERGDWSRARQLCERAKSLGAGDDAIPEPVFRGVEIARLIDQANQQVQAGRLDLAHTLVAQARERGATDAEVPQALREALARAALEVLVPADGAVVLEPSVTVRGRSVAPRVRVGRVEVPVREGAFEAEVRLPSPGTHTIVIETVGGSALPPTRLRVTYLTLDPAVAGFLSGWAVPPSPELDKATGYPQRIRRLRDDGHMALVPAGTFFMGAVEGDSSARDDEKPRHAVTLSKAFYLDVTEVTNAQFQRFVEATSHRTTAEESGTSVGLRPKGDAVEEQPGLTWKQPTAGGKNFETWPRLPVVHVSWTDANAFAAWVGAALPTEAQFERALRGTAEGTRYPWGQSHTLPERAGNFRGSEFAAARPAYVPPPIRGYQDGSASAAPVGAFGAGAWGLHDATGNVWEWCADHYRPDYYASSPGTDPRGPTEGNMRVVRGGSWLDGLSDLRSSRRFPAAETSRFSTRGFRCARTLP